MAITEFGKAVRKARIDCGETLTSMAESLRTTPSFLSAMETGRKKIPPAWVEKISDYFESRQNPIENIRQLAEVANESVPIDGLPLQQQMLVAGFAQSRFSAEQLKKIADLLEELQKAKDGVK